MMLPRHFGASFDLKGGTGGITGMYSLKDYLEIHKPDYTFKVQTPETLDPDETVSDIPWVITEIPNVGSANPIVARIFVQSSNILKQASLNSWINKDAVLEYMHSCKEELIVCENVLSQLNSEYEKIIKKIKNNELERQGKALYPFPQIPDLLASATTFLTSAKRALQRTAQAFGDFYQYDISNPKFHLMIQHLKKQEPVYSEYVKFLETSQVTLTNILDLRNYQEHPKPSKKTVVHNFKLTPKGISPPSWHVTGNSESPLIEDMKAILDFLINFSESNFLYCVSGNFDGWIPWRFSEITEDKRNIECPVRFKLDVDLDLLRKQQN